MEILSSILIIAGTAFALIASIGTIRLPDAISRMHAATKAGSFGASLILIGACIHFGTASVVIESLLIVVFFYLTAPIATHLLARTIIKPTQADSLDDQASKRCDTPKITR